MEANIKSHSEYLVCPPAALSTSVHLILKDWAKLASSCCKIFTPLFHQATSSQTRGGGTCVCEDNKLPFLSNCRMRRRYKWLTNSAFYCSGHICNNCLWFIEQAWKTAFIDLQLSLNYKIMYKIKDVSFFAEIYVYTNWIQSTWVCIFLCIPTHNLDIAFTCSTSREDFAFSTRSVFARFTSHYTVVFNRV